MLKINPAEGSAEYLTVSEAADFLGVSPWTLRNWDKSGRLKPSRHPKNGYRIYRRQDLAAVMEPVESLSGLRAKFTPRIDWRDMGDSEHFVQFYETDSFLVDSVSGFVGTALVTGQAAVVIATQAHRTAIEQELKNRGLDVSAAARGQYIALDAGAALGQFRVDGVPDPQRFSETIGELLTRAAQGGRKVRAFGEMMFV